MVIRRSLPAFSAAILVAACARRPQPNVVPEPAAAAPATPAAPAPAPAAPAIRQSGVATTLNVPGEIKVDSARVTAADVTKSVVGVFGDSTAVDANAMPDSAADAPSWDIEVHPYETTDRVEHYVRLFTGPAKERIEARLERGTRYEPMIRARMHAGGIPEDMYYLALVESGFDPNAYSRAAAVGMWQFMTSTARDMGMRVDWWIDERRDPVKSTDAAVRFIKDLKEQFGSLYLAAAAYNGGPGRISRGLSRYADDLEGTTGDDLFFALAEKDYLRNETRDYVPQLIAAALIAKEPQRYGMTLTPLPPFAYDSVRVGPQTPIAAVAHAAHAQLADIQDLNPHVLRGMTPPRDSFFVRVPVGDAETFAAAFDSLPASDKEALSRVTSKKGESFATIAKRNGLSTRQLEIYNPNLKVLKSGNLAPGQTVVVPSEAVVAAAAPVPDPSIERYSSGPSATMHVVKRGETIGALAKKYHTTTSALMKANHLRRPIILPGQSLIVGGSSMKAALAKSSKSEKAGATVATKKAEKSEKAQRLMTAAAKQSERDEKAEKTIAARKAKSKASHSSKVVQAAAKAPVKTSSAKKSTKTAAGKAKSSSSRGAKSEKSTAKKQIAGTSSSKKKAPAKAN